MLIPKQKPIRCEKHRRFIASLPCLMTGRYDCQAAHIRHGYLSMGSKPSDARCVPLNWEEHLRQHTIGEAKFWGDKLDLAIWTSGLLWTHTGDRQKCLELIAKFQNDIHHKARK